jgi:hypothetical protein
VNHQRDRLLRVILRIAFFCNSLVVFAGCEPAPKTSQTDQSSTVQADALISDLKSNTSALVFEAKVDYARELVHKSSLHDSPEDVPVSDEDGLSRLYRGLNGSERPRFKCGNRAHFLTIILNSLGIDAHLVGTHSDQYDTLQGHIFIEVRNPATDRWEVVDPDYNIYWKDLSGNRLDLKHVVMSDFADIVPCSKLGCSWNNISSQEGSSPQFLKNHGFMRIGAYWDSRKIIVNTHEFDLRARFSDQANQTIREIYSDYSIVLNPRI